MIIAIIKRGKQKERLINWFSSVQWMRGFHAQRALISAHKVFSCRSDECAFKSCIHLLKAAEQIKMNCNAFLEDSLSADWSRRRASRACYNLSHPFSNSNLFVYFYLGSDLVAALAGLQVHNLAHGAAGRTMAGMQEPRFCLLLHALGLSCCFCTSLYNARLLTPLLGWTRGARWRHPHGNQGWRREGGPWARGDTG